MTDDPVLCTAEAGVALLTLNRPERKNAWTIVVTGAGTVFCPGLDAHDLDEGGLLRC